jgi:hypothetical protein
MQAMARRKPCSAAAPAPAPARPHAGPGNQARLRTLAAPPQAAVPPVVVDALRSPGQPLDAQTRAFMEPRFAYDFGRVRVHTDRLAAQSAEAVHARAYTVGADLVFGPRRYQPASAEGQRLLAHELAHVVQQGGKGSQPSLQRQEMQPTDVPSSLVLRDAPKAKTWSGAPPGCGPDFCRPLPSEGMALDTQKSLWPLLMVGIAVKVSSRVLPLWNTWAFGGSSTILDLTKDFGADFASSPTTTTTTNFLMSRIKDKLAASAPALPLGGATTLDIPTLIPSEVAAIDNPSSGNPMDFNVIGDIPGNIAGGIGKDQAANPIGANPSPQDDARIAKGSVTVLDAGANLVTIPNLRYTVKDTIDLCPGNCGAAIEQKATIPMSQWEATGISGDVPFTVDFPGFALPFHIPKPATSAAATTTPPPATPAPTPAPKATH